MNRGETVPFVRRMGCPGMEYLELDLNFSLDYQAGGGDAEGEMLSRRETMPGCGLYTLSLPDFILHLCAHLYKEATVMAWVEMGRDQSLYKYADLYLLTELFLDEELAGELGRRRRPMGCKKNAPMRSGTPERFFPSAAASWTGLSIRSVRRMKPLCAGYWTRRAAGSTATIWT